MHATYAAKWTIIILGAVGVVVTVGLLYYILDRWGSATGTDFHVILTPSVKTLTDFENAEKATQEAEQTLKNAEEAVKLAPDDKTKKELAEQNRQKKEVQVGKLADAKEALDEASVIAVRTLKESTATESSVLTMVALLGALGGSIHYLGSLVKFVGNRQLMRSWVFVLFVHAA